MSAVIGSMFKKKDRKKTPSVRYNGSDVPSNSTNEETDSNKNINTHASKGKGKKKKGVKSQPKITADQNLNSIQSLPEQTVNGQELPLDETEAILLKLHTSLIDFYMKHKQENVDEDVLTILMQFFIDSGAKELNKKLMDKYGEDLNTFKRSNTEEPPPPPADYSSKTLDNIKRRSLEAEYDIQIPPAPKFEAIPPAIPRPPSMTKKRDKKRKEDPELSKFKAESGRKHEKEKEELERDVDKHLFGSNTNGSLSSMNSLKDEKEDISMRLDSLDYPNTEELLPRDLIEAFYSKHDESKLEKDTGIEKFVMWVEQHSLEALSDKLNQKYREGLFEQTKLARRRKNLEDHLKIFYNKHDAAKLETRWTIMKIVNWTMQHGVVALNKKFMVRYGLPVVKLDNNDI